MTKKKKSGKAKAKKMVSINKYLAKKLYPVKNIPKETKRWG
jgi:hypothetical protein